MAAGKDFGVRAPVRQLHNRDCLLVDSGPAKESTDSGSGAVSGAALAPGGDAFAQANPVVQPPAQSHDGLVLITFAPSSVMLTVSLRKTAPTPSCHT